MRGEDGCHLKREGRSHSLGSNRTAGAVEIVTLLIALLLVSAGTLSHALAAEPTAKIFLIALDDNGRSGRKIGCGDSVISVPVPASHTPDALRAAMEELLKLETRHYRQTELYNALYQSDLQLESAAIDDGRAQIRLRGTLKLGGECDNVRVEAQLAETALQFSTVKAVEIYLNGRPLKEALSLK